MSAAIGNDNEDTMALANDRILRLPETEQKSGLKRDAVYKGIREGWFPKPVPLTPVKPGKRPSAVGWLESELNRFIARRAAERDSAAA